MVSVKQETVKLEQKRGAVTWSGSGTGAKISQFKRADVAKLASYQSVTIGAPGAEIVVNVNGRLKEEEPNVGGAVVTHLLKNGKGQLKVLLAFDKRSPIEFQEFDDYGLLVYSSEPSGVPEDQFHRLQSDCISSFNSKKKEKKEKANTLGASSSLNPPSGPRSEISSFGVVNAKLDGLSSKLDELEQGALELFVFFVFDALRKCLLKRCKR